MILSQSNKDQYTQNPITQVQRYTRLGFVTLEFRKRHDADIILLLDEVKEFQANSGKMRIFRVKRFMDWWNDMIDKGKNPTMRGIGSMFSDALGSNQNLQQQDNEDNELFMGGIPVTMPESKVKQLCESFGLLKKFMVHKDPNNPT